MKTTSILLDTTVSGNSNFLLVLLLGIIVIVGILLIYFVRKINKQKTFNEPNTVKKQDQATDLQGEEAAAIALAIHLFKNELHDMESMTITLQKVSRIYSPWSSKIYTLRQHPRYR